MAAVSTVNQLIWEIVMNLVICDDRKSELENIRQAVSEYALAHSELSLAVKCFQNPFDMLEDISRSGAPDIALLDICMPGILGTEAAREILKKSEDDTDIIFLTTSSDFAVEAFALHAGDYLMKPYSRQRLGEALDRVIEKRRHRLYVSVLCGREIHRIDLYTVLYTETRNHSMEIHLSSGRCLETGKNSTELKNIFQSADGFVTVGASYTVNLRCVQSMLETTLEMSNGDRIPVPRRLRKELKKQYFDFYTKEATAK